MIFMKKMVIGLISFMVVCVNWNTAFAELLVYKGKYNGIEYNYQSERTAGERHAWNDNIYILIDFNYETRTVTEAFLYQYWKNQNGVGYEVLPYRLHNLQEVFGNQKKSCLFTTDLHAGTDAPASLAIEGPLVSGVDIGSVVRPTVDLTKKFKGIIIDTAPFFSDGSTIFGDLYLVLDQKITKQANQGSWSFNILRAAVEDKLNALGTVKWWEIN